MQLWLPRVALLVVLLGGCGEDPVAAPAPTASDAQEVSADDVQDADAPMTEIVGGDLGPDGSVDSAPDVEPTPPLTYHGQARAILDARCASCHQSGGAAPFPMVWDPDEWASGPAWWTQMAMDSIAQGRMPPWSPSPDCRPLAGDRSLDAEERATLEAWQAVGFPLGEATGEAAETGPGEDQDSEPTLVTDAGAAYVTDKAKPDDYRCFLLGATFDAPRFARRTRITPGSQMVVHHVMLFLVQENKVSTVEALDAQEEGLGYSCFGGPGVSADFIGGWVPGTGSFDIPEGTAMEIPAGSRLVLQTHYNTVYLEADQEVPEDKTQLAMWLLPEGETPEKLLWFKPFVNWQIVIPPNDPASTHEKEQKFPWNGQVVGVGPHMHNLGTEIRAAILDEDQTETCLVQIPQWDFNWQQIYLFEPGDEVFVNGLSRHRLTCVYDNSPENQPVVNGVQMDPTEVTWGEGTFDEMCVNYLLITAPYAGTLHGCGNFQWCVGQCGGDVGCAEGCVEGTGFTCSGCLSSAYEACGQEHCPELTSAAVACNQGCVSEELDASDCKVGACRELWQAAHECVEPLMFTDACQAHFGPCDLGPQ